MASIARQQKSQAKKMKLKLQITTMMAEVVVPLMNNVMQSKANEHGIEVDEKHFFRISANEIDEKYGENCRQIFKLMFTLYQVGGLSANGEGFKTLWVPNLKGYAIYCSVIKRLKTQDYTPAMILEAMIELGAEESRRVKLDDEPVIISGEELAEYKQLVKKLRLEERMQHEYNVATYWH